MPRSPESAGLAEAGTLETPRLVLLGCYKRGEAAMDRFKRVTFAVCLPYIVALCGCQDIAPHDRPSLIDPHVPRSEILGLVAGFGTTFAAMPDLVAMFRRRSSAGMNPRMAAIMGVFQILWVYYGLLIASRPVIIWNIVAVLVNFVSVGAYFYFAHKEKMR